MSVTPSQLDVISGLIDAAALRHQVTSQNLANVNTPGYSRQEIDFEKELVRRISSNGVSDLAGLSPKIRIDEQSTARADGNNVDVDREIGTLNKNAMLYQTYVHVLAAKLSQLRSAISGQP